MCDYALPHFVLYEAGLPFAAIKSTCTQKRSKEAACAVLVVSAYPLGRPSLSFNRWLSFLTPVQPNYEHTGES